MTPANDLLSHAEQLIQNQTELLTWQVHDDERLNRRPESDQWSLYEIVDHLDKVNRSYFDQLEQVTLGNGQELRGFRRWWGNTTGKFILKSVQPENTRKVKTFPVWTPSTITYQKEVFSHFVNSQQKMIGFMKCSGEAVAKQISITSPANRRLYYPLGLAFQIITDHQLRHIFQGKRILLHFQNVIES